MLDTRLVAPQNLNREGRKVRLAFGVAFLAEAFLVALVMKLFGAGPLWALLPFVLFTLGMSLVLAWRTGVCPFMAARNRRSLGIRYSTKHERITDRDVASALRVRAWQFTSLALLYAAAFTVVYLAIFY